MLSTRNTHLLVENSTYRLNLLLQLLIIADGFFLGAQMSHDALQLRLQLLLLIHLFSTRV